MREHPREEQGHRRRPHPGARADNGIREWHGPSPSDSAVSCAHRLSNRKPAERLSEASGRAQSRPGVHVNRREASRMRRLRKRVLGHVIDRDLRQRLGGPVLGETRSREASVIFARMRMNGSSRRVGARPALAGAIRRFRRRRCRSAPSRKCRYDVSRRRARRRRSTTRGPPSSGMAPVAEQQFRADAARFSGGARRLHVAEVMRNARPLRGARQRRESKAGLLELDTSRICCRAASSHASVSASGTSALAGTW